MGGCQNSGPFLGTLTIRCLIIMNRDPKRDHNFDNHPYGSIVNEGFLYLSERSMCILLRRQCPELKALKHRHVFFQKPSCIRLRSYVFPLNPLHSSHNCAKIVLGVSETFRGPISAAPIASQGLYYSDLNLAGHFLGSLHIIFLSFIKAVLRPRQSDSQPAVGSGFNLLVLSRESGNKYMYLYLYIYIYTHTCIDVPGLGLRLGG